MDEAVDDWLFKGKLFQFEDIFCSNTLKNIEKIWASIGISGNRISGKIRTLKNLSKFKNKFNLKKSWLETILVWTLKRKTVFRTTNAYNLTRPSLISAIIPIIRQLNPIFLSEPILGYIVVGSTNSGCTFELQGRW